MIWCTKAINGVITIVTGTNDTLTLTVDGVSKTITISGGDYGTNYIKHESDLVKALNEQFSANSIPVYARLGGIFGDNDLLRKNVVVFQHQNGGTVANVSGTMATVLNI